MFPFLSCNSCHPRIQRSVQTIVKWLQKLRYFNLWSPGPEADLVPGSGRVWRAWRPPGECPRHPAKSTPESDCPDRWLPSLDRLIKPGCETLGFPVTAPFDLDLILSVSQVSGSAYEWSDGTKFDYDISISDPMASYISGKPGPTCVFIAPSGAWIRASCNIAVDGAICYNTTVTTDSQSKMLSSVDFTREAQHCWILASHLCCYTSGARLQAPPEASRCPQSKDGSQWVQHQDQCYAFNKRFYNYSLHSKEKAEKICQDMGELLEWKVLISIHLVHCGQPVMLLLCFCFSWQMLSC